MKFTNAEYADFILFYGKANENATEAKRLYAEAFPNRRVPHKTMFQSTYTRVCETRCVSKPCGDRKRGFNENTQESVLNSVLEDPSTSVRQISRRKHISKSQVHAILKHNGFHPYHFTKVQALYGTDCQRRLDFCTWMLAKDGENEHFLKRILWTDESNFNREGISNLHNLHHYATQNPHVKLQTKHQHRFSVNVWAAVIGKKDFFYLNL